MPKKSSLRSSSVDFRLIFAVKWPPATIGCHFLASDGDGMGMGTCHLNSGIGYGIRSGMTCASTGTVASSF